MTEMNNNKREDIQKWKVKFQEILGVCQEEIKKTTAIGKKMLNATTANSKLHETYEELGRLTARSIENNLLTWENSQVDKLIEKIKLLEAELENFEKDVRDIKTTDQK